jgi:hypothetical protein
MTAPKKPKGIAPELEKAIAKLLREVMASKDTTVLDKLRVIDRSLKLEAIKGKLGADDYGTGFFTEEEGG